MGLQEKGLRYVLTMIDVSGIHKHKGRICELGNTKLVSNSLDYQRRSFGVRFSVAKHLFEYLNFTDVSIDMNGKDEAIRVDLNNHIDPWLLGGRFDIVLNAGTTEHIEDQYMVFKNIHELCSIKGIMIHIVPLEGEHHGLYQYTKEFFIQMSKLCNWKILDYTTTDPSYGVPKKNYIFCTIRYNMTKRKIVKDGKKQIVSVHKDVDYVRAKDFPFQHIRGTHDETAS